MNVVYEFNSSELNQDLLENIDLLLHSKIYEGKNIKIIISSDNQSDFENLLLNADEENEIMKQEIINEIEEGKKGKTFSFSEIEKELQL